jgi:hypothetical protein
VAFGSVGGERWDEEQARDAPATGGREILDFGFWMKRVEETRMSEREREDRRGTRQPLGFWILNFG